MIITATIAIKMKQKTHVLSILCVSPTAFIWPFSSIYICPHMLFDSSEPDFEQKQLPSQYVIIAIIFSVISLAKQMDFGHS